MFDDNISIVCATIQLLWVLTVIAFLPRHHLHFIKFALSALSSLVVSHLVTILTTIINITLVYCYKKKKKTVIINYLRLATQYG